MKKKVILIISLIIILSIIIMYVFLKKDNNNYNIEYIGINDCNNYIKLINTKEDYNIYTYCLNDLYINGEEEEEVLKSTSIEEIISTLDKEIINDNAYLYKGSNYKVISCINPTKDYIIGDNSLEYDESLCKKKNITNDLLDSETILLSGSVEYTVDNKRIVIYIDNKKLYGYTDDTGIKLIYNKEGISSIGLVTFSDNDTRLIMLTLNDKAYYSKYNLSNVDFTNLIDMNLIEFNYISPIVRFKYNSNRKELFALNENDKYVKVSIE